VQDQDRPGPVELFQLQHTVRDVDAIRELAGPDLHCDIGSVPARADECCFADGLDRLFAALAAEPMSASLRRMLIEHELIAPHC
jgi:hypothetical protein